MTNLERYFGVTVEVDKTLEPLSHEILETRAIRLSKLKGFDIRKFSVYYHKIYVNTHKQKKHFANRFAINERIEILDITFKVNEKQRKTSSIRFFNSYVDPRKQENTTTYVNGEFELRRQYPGNMLIDQISLETELITFIEKESIRRRHKKIKISITPQPTKLYEQELLNNDFHTTDIIVPLLEEVRINIREEKIVEQEKSIEKGVDVSRPSNDIHIEIYNESKKEKIMGDNYEMQTGFGVGPNSKVEIQNLQQINYNFPDNYDFVTLEAEISTLKSKVIEQALTTNDPEKFKISAELASAQIAAKERNGNKILQHLAKGGKWLLETAKEIGVSVVAEIISKSIGM